MISLLLTHKRGAAAGANSLPRSYGRVSAWDSAPIRPPYEKPVAAFRVPSASAKAPWPPARPVAVPAKATLSCARIPAKVLLTARAIVTAGFARDVELVNQ
jgi:hypothetical protein